MKQLTDSGILICLAYEALLSAGIDADEVLRRCNVDAVQINERSLRTPHSAQALFWNAAAQVSGNANIGIEIGKNLPVFKGQVLEYLFLSSATFGEGLRRALNYQRLLSDAISGVLEFDGERPYLTHGFSGKALRPLNESVVLGVIGFFKSLTDGKFQATQIDFDHQAIEDMQEYESVFDCPVKTGQAQTRIYFDKSILNLASPHFEPELLRAHEKVAGEQMARLEKQDLVREVEQIIAETLESGEASLETVSARLGMPSRTLRTRLSEAQTSFNQVLSNYRSRLARRLLGRTDESIDEIVYLTGFSEPSTFYRAFKRWTGCTPVEFRKSQKEK